MNTAKRLFSDKRVLYVLTCMVLFQIIMYGLRQHPLSFFSKFPDIDWPISIAWGAMLIPALIVTSKANTSKPFIFVGCLLGIYILEFWMHYQNGSIRKPFVGFDSYSAITLYALLIFWAWMLELNKNVIISISVMVIFGVIMASMTGRYVKTVDHELWRVAWNFLAWQISVVMVFDILGSKDGPRSQAEIRNREELDHKEFRKAA